MKKYLKALFLFALIVLPFFVEAKDKNDITLYLFHGDGCPHCAEELKFLDEIGDDYPSLTIKKYEVWYDEENAELLKKVEDAFSIKRTGVPTTVIGDTIITGFGNSTGTKIERAILFYLENDYTDEVDKIKNGTFNSKKIDENAFSKQEKEREDDLSLKVPVFGKVNLEKVSLMSSAVIIGLVDGFNPCAMWILLFLISILIGMKDRKRMLLIGLTFLFTSAIVYMCIMLSWIEIAVKMTSIIWIRNIIALIALIGSFINMRSFLRSNINGGCEVVSDTKRKKIFGKIKKFTHEKSLLLALLGAIFLAISVNVVELACSAGLPLVFTELLVLNDTSTMMKILYTLVYIIFFLLDDLIVFFIAIFTMKVTGFSTKYNKYSHLVGAVIMLVVGILLLFKPEWLMFQFK